MGRSLVSLVHSSVFVVSASVSTLSLGIGTSSFSASSSFLGALVIDCGCFTEFLRGILVVDYFLLHCSGGGAVMTDVSFGWVLLLVLGDIRRCC